MSTHKKIARSAVILVGGEAKRAQGREKYFFVYEGKTFIERLIDTLQSVVDEIILVAKDPEQCKRFSHITGVRCIHDLRPGIGPIGGLHAGTQAARGEFIFVCACDMPCVDAEVVRYLFDAAGDSDAVIPSWNYDMIEPLHAVYRRSVLLGYLEDHPSYSLRPMIRSINTRYVMVDELRTFDPALKTFTNINKLDDLEQINGHAPHAP
ncbi:MAG: molybdenum cofactor guanylyltransferase [Methanomicrobiales archaeon]|nr:molybdenum cofactor guanylyltransferase [Methanomicrobiales archaeon]